VTEDVMLSCSQNLAINVKNRSTGIKMVKFIAKATDL